MKLLDVTRGAVGAMVLGLVLSACGGLDSSPTAESTQHPASATDDVGSSDGSDATVVPEPTTANTRPRATEPAPVSTPPISTPQISTPAADRPGSGHGLCFDLNSQLAQDAIATLGTDSNGGAWQPQGASNHPVSGGCGLDWMIVNGSGFNDATYTSRVLLFGNGQYLGTVEPHEYSYTSIAGDTLDSVTVRYRWLRDEDPFCCPQGGPSTVTVTLSGGQISRTGQFPPET
ncbi:LppP/LprE family lipoprotein [Gordonia hydrophobica]|uniref:LppP/LprE family lipoprotein n=1 Tax=Gordonia hydrophobica TaxID=40516 RepID=A0ABZ2U3Q9_9ACTN|nr:LppP/LprE family lipoprotein [Gordonia hydrophobica]MBM7367950.1 hypothetical protein [Gordonia hydrophobica]